MWMEAAEKKELSGVCIINQSAAYDLLEHYLFPNKLQYNGFNHTLEKGYNVSRLNQRQAIFRIVKKFTPHKDQYWLEYSISLILMIFQTALKKLKV